MFMFAQGWDSPSFNSATLALFVWKAKCDIKAWWISVLEDDDIYLQFKCKQEL